MSTEERRLAHRYQLHLPATVRPQEEVGLLNITTEDVSTGGIYFTSARPFTVGMKLDLVLALPSDDADRRPIIIDAEAQVLRVTEIANHFGVAATIGKLNVSPLTMGFALHAAEQLSYVVTRLI